ncbi:unnamed protein product, partial [Brenthis ino]
MPHNTKRKVVNNLKLCPNCLYNHHGKPCISNKKCRICHNDHNSLLHEAFTSHNPHVSLRSSSSSTPGPSAAVIPHNQQVQSSSHAVHDDISEILLPTALIQIKGIDGEYHIMRALLDQGSQTSLITENAAQLLRLPCQRCKGVITGVGAKENNCKGLINY